MKLEKVCKKRENENKKKNTYLLALLIFLVVLFSTYPQFSFIHFFDLISERSQCLTLLNSLNPKDLSQMI